MGSGQHPGDQCDITATLSNLQTRFGDTVSDATIRATVDEAVREATARGATGRQLAEITERVAEDRLRARGLVEHNDARSPGVLFLCVHNAGRSQMAAGWLRHLAADSIAVFSGGSQPALTINENAVHAMAEVGIDISRQLPQPWSDDVLRAVDVVVTMGCGDACPVYAGKRYVDWELDDPAGRGLDEIRPIRDEIERRVRSLIEELLPG